MKIQPILITSLQNEKVKSVVKLRQRSHRDELNLMIIEGFREITRALDNGIKLVTVYFCPECFLGKNEEDLLARCEAAGTELFRCTEAVFSKMAYRDRPEGLLATAPRLRLTLRDISLGESPLVVVAESIEKPGNLGTILRTSDAAGVDAVIVCDKMTDTANPNVIRASIGTLFSMPVAEATSDDARKWLSGWSAQLVCATPHAERIYTELDFRKPTAIVLGAEQYGLSDTWMRDVAAQVRIPMLGQADSLNVAAAATILLYEAARQRGFKPGRNQK